MHTCGRGLPRLCAIFFMTLPLLHSITSDFLFLFSIDTPILHLHERNSLCELAFVNELENTLRPSLHACSDEIMACCSICQSCEPLLCRLALQVNSVREAFRIEHG